MRGAPYLQMFLCLHGTRLRQQPIRRASSSLIHYLSPGVWACRPNGDFIVGTWNPGYVSYWKKLKSNE